MLVKLIMIKLENSIIHCVNNECNEKRMNINSNKYEIDLSEYIKRVEMKKNLL